VKPSDAARPGNDRVVVVLAAMPRELHPLVRRLGLRAATAGGMRAWRGDGVVAAAVGVGPDRAGSGTARVLEEVPARRVIVTGVAGAVGPTLKVGDLVHPATVVDTRSATVRTPSAPSTVGSRVGLLATVGRVHLEGSVRRGTRGRDGSDELPEGTTAVDMETAAIAAASEAKGVPWDVVRAVSDVAGTLTPEIASLLRPDGRADAAATARVLVRNPRLLGPLVRLGLDTARATRVATAAVISELATAGVRPASRRRG